MAMHFAACCHPLPGDRIVGIVTTGKGVTIHTIDCEMLEQFAETPERWLDIAWNEDPKKDEAHVGRINLVVANQPGSLGSLSTVIGRTGGNISNLTTAFAVLHLVTLTIKDGSLHGSDHLVQSRGN